MQAVRAIFGNCGRIVRGARNTYLRLTGVSIGKDTFISLGAKLDTCRGKIIIGDRCEITHGSVIVSHDAALKRINRKSASVGTVRIGNNVFIGVNAVVLRDVTIGDNSVVGAGSVVTKDVPENVVVAGNPARIIRYLTPQPSGGAAGALADGAVSGRDTRTV
jgi:acetyltransferase-like isoleucine patch superfamily enzyme